MSSTSVNIHESGFQFPGNMKKYYWQFPTITMNSKNGNFTHWTIYVGIMENNKPADIFNIMNKKKNGKPNPEYDANESFATICMPLKKQYLNHMQIQIPDKNVVGYMVVNSHYDSSPDSYGKVTKVISGKNLNRKNATNIFTQAMREALSKYNKKQQIAINQEENYISPMLATGESLPVKDDAFAEEYLEKLLHKNKFLLAQQKLDGIRMMATIYGNHDEEWKNEKDGKKVYCYSRGNKKILISDELLLELNCILEHINTKYPKLNNVILDGELYIHGKHLNEISGYVRNENKSANKSALIYNIFDIYYEISGDNEISCARRLSTLEKLQHVFNINFSLQKIKFLKYTKITTAEEGVEYYNRALAEKYEGAIMRIPNAKYEISSNGYHSKNMIKMKPMIRDEFVCIDYKEGKGKSKGLAIIRCKLTEANINNAKEYLSEQGLYADFDYKYKDTEFDVTPKLTEEERQKLYLEFASIDESHPEKVTVFDSKYKGQLYTCEFRSYSHKNLKPERAVGINFRFDI